MSKFCYETREAEKSSHYFAKIFPFGFRGIILKKIIDKMIKRKILTNIFFFFSISTEPVKFSIRL